jgi:hypothetical protein
MIFHQGQTKKREWKKLDFGINPDVTIFSGALNGREIQ